MFNFVSERRSRRGRTLQPACMPVVCELLEKRVLLTALTIAQENALPGAPESQWDVSGAGDATLQGFATDISVNVGQTVSFKINDAARAAYHIDIYRMGYYQGDGARLITSIPSSQTLAQVQPAPISDSATGLVDCGNWAVSASWAVPADATSGIYFAKLIRNDTGGASHVVFIVRNDASHSNVLFQTSDATWEAYNTWGPSGLTAGNSLYEENGNTNLRAYKVSYNRPFTDRALSGTGQAGFGTDNWLFHAEYPMVRWLEQNGYDVTYFTDMDSDRYGSLIQNHKVFMSVGHDEYWSGGQRTNVEAARDAGVNLAFFSGNEVFWKTRWENSIDSSKTPYRTLVCYKETHADAVIDPMDPPIWTGSWMDPRFSPPADGGRPQNQLTGTLFTVNRGTNDVGTPFNVPFADSQFRFWRNTSVAKLTSGQTATLGDFELGYEWDEDVDNGFRPAGLVDMSSTTQNVSQKFIDYGNNVAAGVATHSLTLYRAPSGALVFGAGTVQWSWGLDGNHDDGSSTPVPAIQQATVNLLADMGVQPSTLQSGLVAATASADKTPPKSTITSPTAGATVHGNTTVTITGTASDSGGGVVAGVEVSTDGGTTWHPATGRNSWTYAWTPNSIAPVTLLSRATDDSANIETPSAGVTVNVTGPMSIWSTGPTPITANDPDPSATEVGVKFRSDVAGYIKGIRFYKGSSNTGTHLGDLWSSSGTLLATATFTGETASGWQSVMFSNPVPINPNVTYVVAYHTNVGHYAEDDYSFQGKSVDTGPLHALQSGVDGPDGVYAYGSGSVFPNATFQNANYWVDVWFDVSATDTTAPTVTAKSPSANATNVSTAVLPTVTFSEPIQPSTVSFVLKDSSGNAVAGTTSYSGQTNTVTFTPSAGLASSTTYTVTVSGAKDLSGNTMSPVTWSFTTGAPLGAGPYSIFSPTSAPVTVDDPDAAATEIGVKFRSDVAGTISGIRFYKGPTNTGVHLGDLWSSTGTLLATATFSGETASGWQQVNFATPVTIRPNTTYVAAYHTNVGSYAEDDNSFVNGGVDNGPLHALQAGVDGPNGVYAYGTGSVFPTQNWLSANYWVDVVFNPTINTGPTVTAETPAPNATNVAIGTTVTATFNKSVQQSTISFVLKNSSGTVVPSTLTYNNTTFVATLTPNTALAYSTVFTATVTGAKDQSGNAMSGPVTWSFTTQPAPTPPVVTAQTPAPNATGVSTGTNVTAMFNEAIQQSTLVFTLTGPGGTAVASTVSYNAATQTATLTPNSALAGSTTYTATASGAKDQTGTATMTPVTWSFTTAIPDTTPPTVTSQSPAPGSTGIATSTSVSATFSEQVQASTISFVLKDSANNTVPATVSYNNSTLVATLTPTSALALSTVYTATVSGAKDTSGNVMTSPVSWSFTTAGDTTPPTVTAQSPAPGATGVSAGTVITATFSESIQPSTLSFVLKDPNGVAVAATVNYDDPSRTATLTPSAALNGSTTYTATVSGAKDLAGNTLASPSTWSFTTAVPIGGGPFTIWSASAVPGVVADPDGSAVEVGVKFRSDVAGFVTGIRFYKGSTNTGTHIGNLWSSTGTLLASATFTGESASGWQQVNFSAPIAINANTTYVASYHTSVGHYADDSGYFATSVDNGPLHALADGADGPNGVYAYGTSSAFPTNTWNSSNYWVDIVFSKNLWTQTTAADFGAGTASGTSITSNSGGEVQLAPSYQDDFSGSSLAASWTTTSWTSAGGGPTSIGVSGGILTLAGAEIRSAPASSYPAIEGRITIAGVAQQQFGLATDLAANAGNYWAVFTTGTSTTALSAQVNVNGTLTTTSLGTRPSGYHVYRVQPIATGFQFYIDGVLKTTISKTFPAGTALNIVLSAFSGAPSAPLLADWARVASYVSGGTFVSSVLDTAETATWGAANFAATLPANTSILIETSSGNVPTPDASWSSWSALGSGNVVSSPPARYLRYRVTLLTTDISQTAILSDITISYS